MAVAGGGAGYGLRPAGEFETHQPVQDLRQLEDDRLSEPNVADLGRAVAEAQAAYLALKADRTLPRTRADGQAIEAARQAWEDARAAYIAARPAG